MAVYEITYAIIPPGVGPDDYEPADLERRTEQFDLPDPEPAAVDSAGQVVQYGPPMPLIHQAIEERLGDGSRVHVSDLRLV